MASATSPTVKAEPAENMTNGIDKTEPKPEPPTTEKSTELTTVTPQSSTDEVASPQADDTTSANQSRPATQSTRPPLKFDAATEERVRDLLGKVRNVANGGDNAFDSENDIYDLTLLTNNLVQLMNAAYIATDTIVRGVSYMQGESHAHPKTAMFNARQDRRAQKAAEAYGPVGPAGFRVTDKTRTAKNANIMEPIASTGSNKENTAPATADQHENSKSSEGKTGKKKNYWTNRRNNQKLRDSTNQKTQENKADDQVDTVAQAKDNAVDKEAVQEDKPETSGSDTVAEETQGQAVAVNV